MSDFMRSISVHNKWLFVSRRRHPSPTPVSNVFNQWTKSFISVSLRGKTVLPTTTMFLQENLWSKKSPFYSQRRTFECYHSKNSSSSFPNVLQAHMSSLTAPPLANTQALLLQSWMCSSPRSAVFSYLQCPLCSSRFHPALKHTSSLKSSPDSKLQWCRLPLISPSCYFLNLTVWPLVMFWFLLFSHWGQNCL